MGWTGPRVGAGSDLPEESFDRVLVDAPCTGLGALRRRPEARWRRVPADLPPLTRLQRELLGAALAIPIALDESLAAADRLVDCRLRGHPLACRHIAAAHPPRLPAREQHPQNRCAGDGPSPLADPARS